MDWLFIAIVQWGADHLWSVVVVAMFLVAMLVTVGLLLISVFTNEE